MRSSILFTSLLASVALASDSQAPIVEKAQGWFDKAKSYIPSGTPSIPNPVEAGAAAIAAMKVHNIGLQNYQSLLAPKLEGEEEWLIYLTGANKTCFNRCGRTNKAWNESVALLSVLPQPAGAPTLKLGQVDCEVENSLCAGWATGCPSAYHFLVPQVSSADARTPGRYLDLNISTTTAQDFVKMVSYAPDSKIMSVEPYEGAFHPVDGWLAKLGVQKPVGQAVNFMGTTPSWLMMIGISFFTRQYMSRRMVNKKPSIYGSSVGAPAAAAPPPAAKPATPASAGRGGKKRR